MGLPRRIVAYTHGGRRHALKRRNNVTFEEGARRGTFSGRLTDGTPVRGNFRC